MKFMILLVCLLVGAQADTHIRARRSWLDDLKETASKAGDAIADAGKTVYNGAKEVVENPGEHLEKAGTAIKDGAEKVGEVAADAGKTVYNGAKDVVEHPQENLEKAGTAIKEGAVNAAEWTKDTAQKGYEGGKAIINDEETHETFSKAMDDTSTFLKGLWNHVKFSVSEALQSPQDPHVGASHEDSH